MSAERNVRISSGMSWALSVGLTLALLALSFWAVDEWIGDVPYWFQIFLPGLALLCLWKFAGSDGVRGFWGDVFIRGRKVWLFLLLALTGLVVIGLCIWATQYYLEEKERRTEEAAAERREFLLGLGVGALEIDAPAPGDDSPEDAGPASFENYERRLLVLDRIRSSFTDPQHGLSQEDNARIDQITRLNPEEKLGYFNAELLSNATGLTLDKVLLQQRELQEAYSEKYFGEAIKSDSDFFNRVRENFLLEDEAILSGLGLGLENLDPDEVREKLQREYHYEEARIRTLGEDVAAAVRDKLEPYRDEMEGWRESGKDGISKEESGRLRVWLKELRLSDLDYVIECLSRESPPALRQAVDKIVDKEFSGLL